MFEAWTKPELFKQWWVPKSMGMFLRSCEMDVRVGGRYRLVFGHDASNPDEFFGRYIEVTPHSRLVWTNEEGGDGGPVTTVTFEEKGGKTLLVLHELYPSKEALDAAGTGAADAMGETVRATGRASRHPGRERREVLESLCLCANGPERDVRELVSQRLTAGLALLNGMQQPSADLSRSTIVGRDTGAELDVADGWTVMSKRFLRWVETWIEENIPPGANPDIESHDAKAKRLSDKLFAEAAAAGFKNFEIDEERAARSATRSDRGLGQHRL